MIHLNSWVEKEERKQMIMKEKNKKLFSVFKERTIIRLASGLKKIGHNT